MIYLYAVTDRPGAPLPARCGLADAVLCEAARGDLAGVFSRHEQLQAEPEPEVLWAHEEVVEALMRDRAVLPMRFGTCLPGEAALVALLEDRGTEFTRMLARVRGRVELSVRIAGGDAPPQERPSTGSEYMQQRLGARRQAERIARAVHAPLARMAERSTSKLEPRGAGLMTGSYLLRDEGVPGFTEKVRQLQRAHPDYALTCTGPWPPYSFVGEPQA